jgi:hypothetical protein
LAFKPALIAFAAVAAASVTAVVADHVFNAPAPALQSVNLPNFQNWGVTTASACASSGPVAVPAWEIANCVRVLDSGAYPAYRPEYVALKTPIDPKQIINSKNRP